MWLNNVLETIGNTPIIKLNKITKNWPGTILAKVDYFNPGNSIKDRMALNVETLLVSPYRLWLPLGRHRH